MNVSSPVVGKSEPPESEDIPGFSGSSGVSGSSGSTVLTKKKKTEKYWEYEFEFQMRWAFPCWDCGG